jgi:16S rRNA pseudouridine516 synthase
MRVDKFLSQMKFCSRKQAKIFLKSHKVVIDNHQIFGGDFNFDPSLQKISIDGEVIFYEDPIYLALNKPKGYVSANKDNMHSCVIDLIKEPYNRFDFKIAGRLDIDTEGLLLLSTDEKFVHEITHPNHHLPKTYIAVLDKKFTDANLLLNGVEIRDGHQEPFIAKALDIKTDGKEVMIVIDEGKFHQVKRMFLKVGYEVIYLKRTQIGNLKLNNLFPGTYRQVRKDEIL